PTPLSPPRSWMKRRSSGRLRVSTGPLALGRDETGESKNKAGTPYSSPVCSASAQRRIARTRCSGREISQGSATRQEEIAAAARANERAKTLQADRPSLRRDREPRRAGAA